MPWEGVEVWPGGGASSVSSRSSRACEPFMRSIPRGENMSNEWVILCKTGSRKGNSVSIICLPSFQQVWRTMSETFTLPRQDPGLIWSTWLLIMTPSLEREGSLRWRGALSQSGCFARIVDTSVVPVRWWPSCNMSRFASFPTIVRRIPYMSSNQSVPSRMCQKQPWGSLTLAFATQK